MGENPDISEGLAAFVAAVHDQRVGGGIVDGTRVLPCAGRGAEGAEQTPAGLSKIVGIVENPHIVEVVILAAEAAEENQLVRAGDVDRSLAKARGGGCSRRR